MSVCMLLGSMCVCVRDTERECVSLTPLSHQPTHTHSSPFSYYQEASRKITADPARNHHAKKIREHSDFYRE